MMDIEKDLPVPEELLNLRLHDFPFKGPQHRVLNFLVQGLIVFMLSAIGGFWFGYFINVLCR